MSTTDETNALHPRQLDPDALDPAAYHTVVGPSLQVAAEVAAARGDPTLHADMPAMLALIDLVSRLAEYWRTTHADDDRTGELLDGAPSAACVMVLQEAEMPPDAVGQCLAALETAYAQLAEHEVTEVANASVERAWQALQHDNRDAALAQLKQAAQQIVAAIEAWQAQVH